MLKETNSLNKDLRSIQQARELVAKAYKAQRLLSEFDQGKIDRIISAMFRAGYDNARRLAMMAVEETGFGVAEDKVIKNQFATKNVYEHIKEMRTAGVISEGHNGKVIEIAEPMGVVLGIIPTTNPTSTILYKALIALKARNTIVFSPHPRAIKCSVEAARIMEEAAVSVGAPEGAIKCLTICTKEGTEELMRLPEVAVILATGGSGMVKAAYSAGKPAYGVGPGNVPAFIERTADISKAVADILLSKTFDNGTICASEQAIVTEEIIAERVIGELRRQGGYFLPKEDLAAVEKTIILPTGGVNPRVVGQSPKVIADLAGISIPEKTKVLVARLNEVGKSSPLSAEKLCPVLAFYIEKDWQKACERCYELIRFGGVGHSLVIHSQNNEVIKEFAMKKPVFRILVNTPSSQGAIGLTTGLAPALTLGCGTWGGSITADNVGPLHLINRKRLAYNSSTAEERRVDERFKKIHFTREEVIRAVEGVLEAKYR